MNSVRDFDTSGSVNDISNGVKATYKRLIPQKIKLDDNEKYRRLFSAKNGNALSFRSGHVILKQNESIGEHSTDNSEEILIILEGKGVLCIKGLKRIDFERDMALYVPPNTVHDVRNTGKANLKYVFITCVVSRT